MKILITGTNGFIGRNIKELLQEKYESIHFPKRQELNLLETSKLKYQQRLDANAKGLIKTEIKLLDTFFFAEDYHQKYLYKNPNGYCGLQGLNIRYL